MGKQLIYIPSNYMIDSAQRREDMRPVSMTARFAMMTRMEWRGKRKGPDTHGCFILDRMIVL